MGTAEHNDNVRLVNERRQTVEGFYPGANGSYFPIVNKFKFDAQTSQCLRAFAGDNTVVIAPCAKAEDGVDLNTLRQWGLERSGGYFLIINKYKTLVATAQCLRTFSDSDAVGMDTCDPQDGSYHSMRLWKVVKQANGDYALVNKFRGDANRPPCLRTFSADSSVSMGTCEPAEKQAEYFSMRYWRSGAFLTVTPE